MRCINGPRTIRRGEPNASSGRTCSPSMITANSASMPIAPSDAGRWRSRDALPAARVPRLALRRSRFPFRAAMQRFDRSSERVAVELRVERIGGGVVRHRNDVAEVEVQVVVGEPTRAPERAGPHARQLLARYAGESLDRLA